MYNFTPGVSLITCTGDRPEAFELCKRYVLRQTYSGPIQWIVVDDGQVPGEISKEFGERGIEVERVFPTPKWTLARRNTLCRNLLAALPKVKHDRVMPIEDDDWYAPEYVSMMADALTGFARIVGEVDTCYYHVPLRQYRVMKNDSRASLCQTAIRKDMLPVLDHVCRDARDYVDVRLWQAIRDARVFVKARCCVGMKGLPGRPGIGIGHHPETHPLSWTPDRDMKVLREWIGDDVFLYKKF